MSRDDGFTLIELLVAMTAGALILALLSWSVASLGQDLRASAREENERPFAAVAPLLTHLIEEMHSLGGDPSASGPRSLILNTVAPAALGAGPANAILSVKKIGQFSNLNIRFEPRDVTVSYPSHVTTERELANGFRDIRFNYVRAEEAGVPPKLIKITFVDRHGKTSRLAVAPHVNSSGNCRFDPISLTCRR